MTCPRRCPNCMILLPTGCGDYGEDHPEISLFDLGSYSSQLLYSLLLNDYIAYMQKQGRRARL